MKYNLLKNSILIDIVATYNPVLRLRTCYNALAELHQSGKHNYKPRLQELMLLCLVINISINYSRPPYQL
jgi:hypothetical protein